MKWMRGLWAGASLLLVLSGCSKDPTGRIEDAGIYSPLITGIAADKEPAVRGVSNEFTVLVTNVSGFPITYHWSAGAGTFSDSIGATAVWNAPDVVGTYPITVSIESNDDAGHSFFKTTTFQVFVDNEYLRWTRSPEVQFDPAPTQTGGVVFAQFRNIVTGAADIYNLAGAGGSPVKLTQDFATMTSPSLRSDGLQIAFAGRRTTSDSVSIWSLPGTGGDPSMAIPVAWRTDQRPTLANPIFARTGRWLLYNADSITITNPKPWFRDGDLQTPEQRVLAQDVENIGVFWMPAWGPDTDSNGLPDSIVCPGYYFFGAPAEMKNGLFKFGTTPEQTSAVPWLLEYDAKEVDWSRDGQYIIYTKRNSVTGDRDIWIINAASSDPSTAVRVTFGPADDSRPRFSPDGTAILFVSNRADYYGLNGIFNTERRGTNIWSVTRFDRP
jgi:Tol biopolymer transport system component